ncbi:MAG: DUF368 domain-containing protein [Ilumatobacteraceae bacterium]
MPVPTPITQVARGFAMGAADIVPGVSGGTVALVLGIYERLIKNVHAGAHVLKEALRGRFSEVGPAIRKVEWVWLVSLLVGILAAVAALSSIIERLLHEQPVRMAALFFGLVVGSVTVAWRLVRRKTATEFAVMLVVGLTLFLVLGLRSNTEAAEDAAEGGDEVAVDLLRCRCDRDLRHDPARHLGFVHPGHARHVHRGARRRERP